jgi:glyoxylase-like metal-dependent hydrolase (beta-lactamase superfamily II)
MQSNVYGFFHETTGSVQYIIWGEASKTCVIIDPVLDFDRNSGGFFVDSANRLLHFVKQQGLDVECVIDTHPHADHFSAAKYLSNQTGASTAIGEHVTIVQKMWQDRYDLPQLAVDGTQWDRLLSHGEVVRVAGTELTVMHAPGHTAASVILYNDDVAFVNDTVFMPDVGTARADFPGARAEELWQTIRAVFALPKSARLMVGHDYPPELRKPQWQCSVLDQSKNIHIAGKTAEEFVAFRHARDTTLPLPDLMLLALQVNLNGGIPPWRSIDGRSFLKVPVSWEVFGSP